MNTNLKRMKIWVTWLNGNPGKKPSLNGKRYAKWSDRSILMTYDEAINLQTRTPGLSGVGFVIPDGYVVIDLDDCIKNNIINDQAQQIIDKFNSYTEKSPSGKGIHIIVSSNPGCTKWYENINGQKIEYITPGNFITFTGDVVIDSDIREVAIENPEKKCFVRASSHNKPIGGGGGNVKYASRYGKAALDGECQKVRSANVGSRTNTLFKASFKIGQLIPGGYVSEFDAILSLESAGLDTGLPQWKVQTTIKSGMEKGKLSPR